jgi:cation:H+ antiporter
MLAVALSIALILVGLVLLARAPDHFVEGSATVARRMGISAVVVGAVIVGFGTSAPELLVSSLAAAGGEPEIGIGNVIGSNIANLTLILGLAGLFAPLVMPRGVVRRELPLTLVATGLFAVLVGNGLTTGEGIVLLLVLAGSLVVLIRGGRADGHEDDELARETDEYLEDEQHRSPARITVDVVGGLVGTVAGAQLLVTGAVDLADRAGLSGGFVGLTLVAVGTSLPELVTAVAAARRGETQLVIGNLLGSNLFNSLAVAGAVGIIGSGVVTDATLTVTAVILMIAATLLGVASMLVGGRVRRYEGVGLVGAWVITLPLIA